MNIEVRLNVVYKNLCRVKVAYFGHLREDDVISPTHDACLIAIALLLICLGTSISKK